MPRHCLDRRQIPSLPDVDVIRSVTDHYALQWLKTMHTGSALFHHWSAALEEYDFTVKHRPEKAQTHVDGLSRLPVDPPPLEDASSKFGCWKTRRKPGRSLENYMLLPTSVATLYGNFSMTDITTKQVAASVWRPPRAARSASWAPITAIARRRQAPFNPKGLRIPSPSILWAPYLPIDATSS